MLKRHYVLGSIVLLSLLLVWARFDEFTVGSMGDDAVYTELARSIAEGKGPILHYGAGSNAMAAHGHPSGYPLLISPLAYFFPSSLTALKLGSTFFFFAFAALYFLLVRSVFSLREVQLLTAAVLLNPWTIAYANRAFSESAYLCVSFAAALMYDRWLRSRNAFTIHLVVLTVSLALVFSIRSIGLSLLLAVALHLVYRRQWGRLGAWGLCQIIPMMAIMFFLGSGGGDVVPKAYSRSIAGLDFIDFDQIAFMAWTLFYYVREITALTLPVFGQAANAIAVNVGWGGLYTVVLWSLGFIVLLGSLVGGMHKAWREAPGVQLLYIYYLIFLGVLCNWTYIPVDRPGGWVELRLLIPLLPLIYLFGLGGLRMLAVWVGSLTSVRGPLWILFLVLPLSLAHNVYRIQVPFKEAHNAVGRGFIDFSAGTEWIREHTGFEDVIMTSSRLERHIHHHRPTVGYEEFNVMDRSRVRYVFVGPNDPDLPNTLDSSSENMLRQLKGNPERFELASADLDSDWHIYRVVR